MKKFIIILSVLFLNSCSELSVQNPGYGAEEVYLKVGSKVLKVHVVTISSSGNRIYILTPKDTTVEVFTEVIGFTDGKTPSSVIKVE